MTTYDGPDVRDCVACSDLVDGRTKIVNGRGAEDARLAIVGEAPGRFEDEAGRPFVGRSGEILEASLLEFGVDPAAVRITNCVRCRPPDNRNPYVGERRNCRAHLDNELSAVDPSVVLTLGRVPTLELTGEVVTVTDRAGDVIDHEIAGRTRHLVIGLHPAATLYNRSTRPIFDAALEQAIELAGLG